jgi:hypothetical protein
VKSEKYFSLTTERETDLSDLSENTHKKASTLAVKAFLYSKSACGCLSLPIFTFTAAKVRIYFEISK